MAFDADVKDEIRELAAAEGIDPAALLAIAEVESGGRAFTVVDGARRPMILYEYHVFHRNLPRALRAEAVRLNLARPRWRQLPYRRSQAGRYAQLARAAELHEEAAHMACSWGIGQVLGENAAALGYPSAVALAEEAMSGVAGQMRVMLRFIDANGLRRRIAARDWHGFARVYNGPGQAAWYGRRIAAAWRRHGGGGTVLRLGDRGEAVAVLQRRLRGLGHAIAVDGDFGPATRRAVIRFQLDQGLRPDGIAGARTLARLHETVLRAA